MNATESPVTLPGGDATKGRFEWFHNACGTIYADTLDDAIACAYHRIVKHDPANAAQSCKHVERVGYNAAHGSDWVAPVPVSAQAGPNPILLDIAVPGAPVVNQAPPVEIPTTPAPPAEPVPSFPAFTPPLHTPEPVPPAPSGGTLPAAPGAPDFTPGS